VVRALLIRHTDIISHSKESDFSFTVAGILVYLSHMYVVRDSLVRDTDMISVFGYRHVRYITPDSHVAQIRSLLPMYILQAQFVEIQGSLAQFVEIQGSFAQFVEIQGSFLSRLSIRVSRSYMHGS